MNPASPLHFRDVERGRALQERLHAAVDRLGRTVTVMHVCGSHEQAMARYGMRSQFPKHLEVLMGPGCPVCVTDAPEIDEAIALASRGVHVLTWGDMLRVPGRNLSLADARAAGAPVSVIHSATQAIDIAQQTSDPVVFFASGFETTAVATAAILRAQPPENLLILSAHRWVPAAMEVVAQTEDSHVEGFLAAGHAATITGWGVLEPLAAQYRTPIVVAGFEPLDILAGLTQLVEEIAAGRSGVVNAFPRCVTRAGNQRALHALWDVFEPADGIWRGIANVERGSLQLRPAYAHRDARRVFSSYLQQMTKPSDRDWAIDCRCGAIMTGRATPVDCPLFGRACTPETPVGACMVSSEGACRIWFDHGDGGGL